MKNEKTKLERATRARAKRNPMTPPTSDEEVRLFTVEEAASLLGMTVPALYARAARRQIPGVVRDGRWLRFRADMLRQYIDDHTLPVVERPSR